MNRNNFRFLRLNRKKLKKKKSKIKHINFKGLKEKSVSNLEDLNKRKGCFIVKRK